MGYYSDITLKTTTEGYLACKIFNDKIEDFADKPLDGTTIKRTASGFYKIILESVKWYDSYPSVNNFNKMLLQLEDLDIPYKFIRIGEDYNDIEMREHYTDDMPEEISDFCVSIEYADPDLESSYETIRWEI